MVLPASFVDSNVLIYAFDRTDMARQGVAQQLLVELRRDNALLLSTQVLNETYRNLANPRPSTARPAVTHSDVVTIVTRLIEEAYSIVSLSPVGCLTGYDLANRHKMHLWDALILAAALEARAVVLYTEDLPGAVDQETAELEGVRYINPFSLP